MSVINTTPADMAKNDGPFRRSIVLFDLRDRTRTQRREMKACCYSSIVVDLTNNAARTYHLRTV